MNKWADFSVFETYEIREYKGKKVIEVVNERINKSYNPFKVEYLFEEMDKINPDNEDNILDFIHDYGLLGGEVDDNDRDVYNSFNSFYEPVNETFHVIERLEYFKDRIKTLKVILRVIQELQQNKNEASDWLQKWLFFWGFNQSHDWRENAISFIFYNINHKLHQVSPRLILDNKGEGTPGFTGLSLIGITYFQIYEIFQTSGTFRNCLQCGALFAPRANNYNKFCPPREGQKNSSCQNSFYQWKNRVKKALNEGKSKQEIADKKGITLERLEFLLKQ